MVLGKDLFLTQRGPSMRFGGRGLQHWCPPQIQGGRPRHSLVNETLRSAHEAILKQSGFSLPLTRREDIQMIILKIATIGIVVALLSTGLGSELALAIIAII